MSRTPLREVLHRLAGEGYVTLEQNRGAKVVSMDSLTLRVFFQTALLIYCYVAQKAAENLTSVQLDALKDTQVALIAASKAGEVGDTTLLNHQFHDQIGQMAQNPNLMASLKRMLIDHTRLNQTFCAPHRRRSDAHCANC